MNVPPVICTVALTSFWLSGSLTVTAGARLVGSACSSVHEATVVPIAKVGASLTLVMLTVSVRAVLRLNEPEPSLSPQVTVRVAFEPKFVGFSPALKVMLSRTV